MWSMGVNQPSEARSDLPAKRDWLVIAGATHRVRCLRDGAAHTVDGVVRIGVDDLSRIGVNERRFQKLVIVSTCQQCANRLQRLGHGAGVRPVAGDARRESACDERILLPMRNQHA